MIQLTLRTDKVEKSHRIKLWSSWASGKLECWQGKVNSLLPVGALNKYCMASNQELMTLANTGDLGKANCKSGHREILIEDSTSIIGNECLEFHALRWRHIRRKLVEVAPDMPSSIDVHSTVERWQKLRLLAYGTNTQPLVCSRSGIQFCLVWTRTLACEMMRQLITNGCGIRDLRTQRWLLR